MPTTTATLSLTNDTATTSVSTSSSMTLFKAGTTEGMDTLTSVRKILKSTDQVDLINISACNGATHNFVYINNASTDSTEFITVTQGNAAADSTEVIVEQIGRLYGGDWMFIPWDGAEGSAHDICIKPNVATEMPIEYILFN